MPFINEFFLVFLHIVISILDLTGACCRRLPHFDPDRGSNIVVNEIEKVRVMVPKVSFIHAFELGRPEIADKNIGIANDLCKPVNAM